MSWSPCTEVEIWEYINNSWEQMSFKQRHLWEVIKIEPEKWQLPPWGDRGNGFWVVAIYGRNVIWYNDIEEGFNSSKYTEYGRINDYWCNQDELEIAIQYALNEITQGVPSGSGFSPP